MFKYIFYFRCKFAATIGHEICIDAINLLIQCD